ncbi:helix-turn-helix domain-containing protein [Blastococcus litoris]|uniref:helix-turn-helix domain-containing protein n=1 Tax=Blastococcus litoris TaxID=2171622 RepID=UPI000E30AA86|nr:helix-turn-helix domain-containing protein [Blastococcus litoris]
MRPAPDPATSSAASAPGDFRHLRSSSSLPAQDSPHLRNAEQGRVVRIERDDPLLTVAQAGDYLGTGERFVRRLITERRITYVKIGRFVRLPRSSLDAFIEAGRVLGEEPPR